MNQKTDSTESDIRIIQPGESIWKFNWRELWEYRFLLKFLLLRDLRLVYKQTILGPVHLFLRPIIMTLVFQVVFNKIGSFSTDGIHPFLFYYGNNSLWAFFAGVFGASSAVFSSGAGLMSKVYFPRILPSLSSLLMNAFRFCVQLVLLLIVSVFLYSRGDSAGLSVLFLGAIAPVIQVGLIALGGGFVFGCITLRYRDLNSLSSVIVQGMMYLSPVVYPFSAIPERYKLLASLNPLASAMEQFRYFAFGEGSVGIELLIVGWGVTIFIFVFGMLLFNVTQRKFVDIV